MAIDESLLPTWEHFHRDYVAAGVPHTFVVRSDPAVHLFVEAGGSRLGARFRVAGGPLDFAAFPMQEIRSEAVTVDGRQYLQISTQTRALYRNFYGLAAEVVTEVIAGSAANKALADAIQRWEELLRRPDLLSEERQAGLFGELLWLNRLIDQLAGNAVAAWTGPAGEAHDFRIGLTELEVKTTSNSRRIHRISGVGQLDPSPDCALFLVSLQVTDAGAMGGGQTLAELITSVRGRLIGSDLTAFEKRLANARYFDTHAEFYPQRRKLRTPVTLIKIEDGVPRIVGETLAAIPTRFRPEFIGRVAYDIDVTPFGCGDGSAEFASLLSQFAGA